MSESSPEPGRPTSGTADDADVIVVGAGPAGAAVATYLARAGHDVLVLDKSAFPRPKVCGDGLTPRAVRELIALGVPTPLGDPAEGGWVRNTGLRIVAGRTRLELPWPQLGTFPDYGLVCPRDRFDRILVDHARSAGARLRERTTVTGPLLHERTGRTIGVHARLQADDASGDEVERVYRAPLVVAADGASGRLALSLGIPRRQDRPMGVAVRTYYRGERPRDEWLESWLELWDGPPHRSNLLPGYGWIFDMGDGTSNVGLGILNSSSAFGRVDYRDLLQRWVATLPEEWGFTDGSRTEPVRGAALPMGFNRSPQYARGLMMVGDAAGLVNPFNGEGIAYALQSGRMAAECLSQALARPPGSGREQALMAYPRALHDQLGGYYTLGRYFVRIIGHPEVMRLATRYGLPRPTLMRFTLKLMANLTDPRGGDTMDKVINGLSRLAPTA
ncbi:MAG: menaquinone-9 beta-reductase [Actinomycetota bacterium]|nr:menaquinone-9 beta-reductase [Actinomycetota bacterium]